MKDEEYNPLVGKKIKNANINHFELLLCLVNLQANFFKSPS